MSNLRLIDQTTVLSGVSSVSVPNVFTSDFDVYKIVGANFVGATSTGTGTILLPDLKSTITFTTISFTFVIAVVLSFVSNDFLIPPLVFGTGI